MPNWEYKVITSGALGFVSPQLLEQHLNQLGKEEWEIIHFQTRPDNPLAFQGLARRPVMRDWVVETAPPGTPAMHSATIPAPPQERSADAPSVEALRAEAEERRESLLAQEESLRPLRGASEGDEAGGAEEFDRFESDDDLPTFFEAIRPHMRRDQKGPGLAVGLGYLAKKFSQTEGDLIEALKECGFAIPTSAKDEPAYLEFDGDLYWLNVNHRGQLWINTREKSRRAFKAVEGKKVAAEKMPEKENRSPQEAGKAPDEPSSEPPGAREQVSQPALAEGPALLDRLRPLMRRNRRGAGLSGSVSYLARALSVEPQDLVAAFGALGLVPPPSAHGKPIFVEIGGFVYGLNEDNNGQIWINAREKREAAKPASDETPAAPPAELPLEPTASEPDAETRTPPAAAASVSPLAAVRLLLKETRRGGVAAEVGRIATQLGKSTEDLLAALIGAGMKVPAKAREKPTFAEHAGEIFWLNRNASGELWLNAKVSKFAEKADGTDAARKAARRSSAKKGGAE
jgi:hypothetical protein